MDYDPVVCDCETPAPWPNDECRICRRPVLALIVARLAHRRAVRVMDTLAAVAARQQVAS
jgi:hypothetical protein